MNHDADAQHCESTGKRIFHSDREARIFARNRMSGARIKTYRCDDCHKVHLSRSRVNGE